MGTVSLGVRGLIKFENHWYIEYKYSTDVIVTTSHTSMALVLINFRHKSIAGNVINSLKAIMRRLQTLLLTEQNNVQDTAPLRGMLAALQFRIHCLPVSYITT